MSPRPGFPLVIPQFVSKQRVVEEDGKLSENFKRFLTEIPKAQELKIKTRITTTHAERIRQRASEVAEGTRLKESDTGLIYESDGENWVPMSGRLTLEQEFLPTDLGLADAGLEVFVSDYNHVLRWNGTGWEFLPGDHSGYTQNFLIDPGIGWLPCDGSTGVATLLSDGTLDFSVDLPNTAGLWYRQ
jgi:hypothetical protein